MVKKIYFVNNHGILRRKNNTVYFLRENKKIQIPVEKIKTMLIFSKVTFSSGSLTLFSKKKIPVHIFNKYGNYQSTFYPIKQRPGNFLIKQVLNYLNYENRMFLAKNFVNASGKNMLSNLKFYENKGRNVSKYIVKIEKNLSSLNYTKDINELMSLEGKIRILYYNSFNQILPDEFKFIKRTTNPPQDMLNCLLSFGNSLLYATINNEIYKTMLEPSISFLHEPRSKFSLVFDISEIFKPLIVDRVIFKIVNKKMIDRECFNFNKNAFFLNNKGREVFLENYDKRLQKVVEIGHKKISYQNIIRRECYKLVNHILGRKIYEPFVI